MRTCTADTVKRTIYVCCANIVCRTVYVYYKYGVHVSVRVGRHIRYIDMRKYITGLMGVLRMKGGEIEKQKREIERVSTREKLLERERERGEMSPREREWAIETRSDRSR